MVRTQDKVVRSPRIAARRHEVRAQRRRRRRRILASLIIVAGIGYGAWALMRSSVFSLQKIDIVGATTVSKQEIIDASGLHIGQSALGINVQTVAARIRAVPGIEDAHVAREGSLAIKIAVVERTAAIEVQGNGQKWFLDQQGVQITENQSNGTLPIVDLPAAIDITAFTTSDEANVLAIWAKMSAAMQAKVVTFSLLPDHSVAFDLGQTTVVFGTADQIDQKLLAVQLVAKRVAADHRHLLRLDVRAPERPAARIS
jgi:cell division protein FtsQ